MRNVTRAFRRALADDKRDYDISVSITLVDGTELTLDNTNIWTNGFSMEDSVSADNVFQVGAAIINKATIVINNIYDNFSEYDFMDAKVIVDVGLSGLDDGTSEMVRMGVFNVDEAQYNGSLITLTCLDNMCKFEKAYVGSNGNPPVTYPATLEAIVQNACSKCVVTMDNDSLQFPHRDYVVSSAPSGESTTFRQVISWAAQIAGCFARINPSGKLTFDWYDMDVIQGYTLGLDGGTFDTVRDDVYTTGDTADGGTFNPWNTGYSYDGGTFQDQKATHVISSSYTSDVSTDSIVITGVSVQKKVSDGDKPYETYTSGTTGYVISIEGNEFIQGTHGQDVANWLGTQLIGITFRKATVTHPNDPSFEAGDVALLVDRKKNAYPIIISSTTFNINSSQSTTSSAATPRRNSAQRFTEATRNYVELRKRLEEQKTSFEEAQDELSNRIAHASGLYFTPQGSGSSIKYYYHDKPTLSESNIVMLFSDVGFTLTNNYQQGSAATWYGMTVDGTMISAILNTIGVNADWIRTGTLDAGRVIVSNLSANRITTGTMSADRILGGTLKLGGSTGAGNLSVQNSSGVDVVISDAQGVKAKNGGYVISYGDEDVFAEDNLYPYSLLNMGTVEIGYKVYGPDTLIQTSNLRPFGKITLADQEEDYYNGSAQGVNLGFTLRTNPKAVMNLGCYSGTNYATFTPYMLLQNHALDPVEPYDQPGALYYCNITMQKNLGCQQGLYVAGQKHRVVQTEHYGSRLHCCYETPSPYFGDIGSGTTDANGECYVFIDDIMRETICEDTQYVVFLQKEGPGDLWVAEKATDYFVVKGTPDLQFSWELKAKQRDYATERLEQPTMDYEEAIDYAEEGNRLIDEYMKQAEGIIE